MEARSVLGLTVGMFCVSIGCASAEPQQKRSTEGFTTIHLESQVDYPAPDGMVVRLLPERPGGGIAHFELGPYAITRAVSHRTVDEIWYFLSGRGQLWRKDGRREQVIDVYPGVAITIPQGTQFQVRSCGWEPLAALGVTMPPWPGREEAIPASGPWEPTTGYLLSHQKEKSEMAMCKRTQQGS